MKTAAHRKLISKPAFDGALAALDDDFAQGRYVQADLLWGAALIRAAKLGREYSRHLGTRSLDLLHVASALELGFSMFISFDIRQQNHTIIFFYIYTKARSENLAPDQERRPRTAVETIKREFRRGRSGRRSGSLKRKGEERGHAKKGKGHKIVPRNFLLQIQGGESDEDHDRDHLLNDLELVSGEPGITEAIRRHGQAVLQQRDRPRDQNRLPERPCVTVFQVTILSKGHEDI